MKLETILKPFLATTGRTDSIENEDRVHFLSHFSESMSILRAAIDRGYRHWIITFSGGKDSTTTLIVALETALRCYDKIERIDVVYSDTRVEIPVIRQYALNFLWYIQNFSRVERLSLHCHVVYPLIKDSFWVCLLGKGYPPPHQRFRWCTQRLKITPVEKALRSFIQADKSLILTGVRFGESHSRDGRLYQSCGRGGECGQGVWFEYSTRLKVGYLAPIAHWRECDVWDFLNFYAPTLSYPTQYLEEKIYNGRGTRFGCWLCTVVSQDKAMEKIVALPQWSHLRPLLEFRQHVKDISNSSSSRLSRSNGKWGRLTLDARKYLLSRLLELQAELGMTLISPEEIATIRELWYRDAGEGGKNANT